MIYVGHTIHHKEFLSFFLQKRRKKEKNDFLQIYIFFKTNIVCIIYPKGFISSIQTVKLLVLYTGGISLLQNGKEALRNIAESSGLGRTDHSPSTHFIYFILFLFFVLGECCCWNSDDKVVYHTTYRLYIECELL